MRSMPKPVLQVISAGCSRDRRRIAEDGLSHICYIHVTLHVPKAGPSAPFCIREEAYRRRGIEQHVAAGDCQKAELRKLIALKSFATRTQVTLATLNQSPRVRI